MPLFLSLHSESKWPPAYLHTLHMRPIAPSCSNMRWRITCKHIQGTPFICQLVPPTNYCNCWLDPKKHNILYYRGR